MIVFDVEIKKGILRDGEQPVPGIEYCAGWRDFANMGVACVCTFDTRSKLSRVFTTSMLAACHEYLATDETAGFNTKRFDMMLLASHGVVVDPARHYDALEQIWLKLGLDPDHFDDLHKGWGLDAVMQATFGVRKTGHGADAPVWWQQGHHGRVIDYCLNDVWLEAVLCDYMRSGGLVFSQGKAPLRFSGDPNYLRAFDFKG